MLHKKFFAILFSALVCLSAIAGSGCNSKKEFTVVFSGGEGAELHYGQETQVVTDANQIIEPIYIREGYNFVGWNKAISKINDDTTITAQWKKYSFEVTFLSNGGQDENGQASIVVETNSAYELLRKQPKFTKSGYDLSWDTDLKSITRSCTVCAVWTPKKFDLEFRDENGNAFNNNKLKVSFNQPIGEISVLAPEKENKRFAYWADSIGPNSLPIDKGVVWRKEEGEILYPNYVDSDDFIITYDLDGGERSNKIYSFDENNDVNSSILIDPKKEGYGFVGWLINDSTTPLKSSEIKIKDFLVNGNYCDIKLKAVWSNEPYVLDFETDGGQLIGDKTKEVKYGRVVGKLPVAQKENYEFIGWYYDGKMIEEDSIWGYPTKVTLTAKYSAIYKVRFSLTTTVGADNQAIECAVIKWGSLSNHGTADFEDIMLEIKEGQSLYSALGFGIMPVVDPIEMQGANEFMFGNYWQWFDSTGKAYKVQVNTIFNGANLPGIKGGDTIVIVPFCKLTWTPLY